MELAVGAIVTGKVTGIAKFGAFVLLEGGKSGLVHISEVANTFVNDVNDHLKVGQEVQVKILSIADNGRINLSVKQAQPAEEHRPSPAPRPQPRQQMQTGVKPYSRPTSAPSVQGGEVYTSSGDAQFEDKLKRFMQLSDSKVSDSKIYADRKGGSRRRK